jgi:hypothetical protein
MIKHNTTNIYFCYYNVRDDSLTVIHQRDKALFTLQALMLRSVLFFQICFGILTVQTVTSDQITFLCVFRQQSFVDMATLVVLVMCVQWCRLIGGGAHASYHSEVK